VHAKDNAYIEKKLGETIIVNGEYLWQINQLKRYYKIKVAIVKIVIIRLHHIIMEILSFVV
jgi:hypothetical protein